MSLIKISIGLVVVLFSIALFVSDVRRYKKNADKAVMDDFFDLYV